MKYIKYNLDWSGPIGDQPYIAVAEKGAELEGGVIVNGLDYYGYLWGDDTQCSDAITNCSAFNMVEISAQDMMDIFNTVYTVGQVIYDPLDAPPLLYAGVQVGQDGRIEFVYQ